MASTRTRKISPQLRRKNIALALGLAAFAFALSVSIFVWRYAHNQPAIPQGGTYAATYEIQH